MTVFHPIYNDGLGAEPLSSLSHDLYFRYGQAENWPLEIGRSIKFPLKMFPCQGTWGFPKIVVPQNGWFIMENPIKIDDLRVPLFSETSTCYFSGGDFFDGTVNPLLI